SVGNTTPRTSSASYSSLASLSTSGDFEIGSSHTTKAGWALGAGAEVRLAGNWTGKIEYLYLDFGTVSTPAGLPTNSTPLAINFNSHVTDHIVRVGVNYKFDPNEIWVN